MLKVYTLGDYHLLVNDSPVVLGKRISNTIRLFLLIITNLDTGISKNELLYQLFYSQEKDTDLNANLRITLFRLRKSLRDIGVACPEGSDYIIVQGDVYRWNPDIPIWVDSIAFSKAAEAYLDDGCQDLCQVQHAMELYTGEYLPLLNTEEWVISRQLKLYRLFHAVFEKLYQSFLDQKDYEKAYKLACKSANIYPFEDYQMYIIDCLLLMNAYEKAMQVYTDTSELYFRELGLELPDSIKERLQRMNDHLNHSDVSLTKLHEVLKEDNHPVGSYYCSFPGFMDNFHFVSRYIERSGQSAYVLIATLEDSSRTPLPPKDEKTREISKILKDTIQNTLRKGDVFSAYNSITFLLLLMCTNDKGCDIVINRLESNFKKQNPYKKIRIAFRKFSVQTSDTVPSAVSALYGNQEVCVCIDYYQPVNGQIEGRVYHRYGDDAITFGSFTDFLLELNALYERIGAPQSDRALKSASGKTDNFQNHPAIPRYTTMEIMKNQGKLLTFCLKVIQRRNLTWQGCLEAAGTGYLATFNSELQLMYEIMNLLSQ